jgi:hypothetical protein
MDSRWTKCIALSLATVGLAPSASAETATAGVRAEVVAPSRLAQAATAWLTSNSPGVFTFRIPGTAQAPAVTLTAQTPDGGSAMVEFLASSEGAGAMEQLLTQIAESGEAGSGGIYQLSNAGADGTMSANGMQMILTISTSAGDGGGVMVAIIAFD